MARPWVAQEYRLIADRTSGTGTRASPRSDRIPTSLELETRDKIFGQLILLIFFRSAFRDLGADLDAEITRAVGAIRTLRCGYRCHIRFFLFKS